MVRASLGYSQHLYSYTSIPRHWLFCYSVCSLRSPKTCFTRPSSPSSSRSWRCCKWHGVAGHQSNISCHIERKRVYARGVAHGTSGGRWRGFSFKYSCLYIQAGIFCFLKRSLLIDLISGSAALLRLSLSCFVGDSLESYDTDSTSFIHKMGPVLPYSLDL